MNRPLAFSGRDLLAALAVVLIWGFNFVGMKLSLREFTPFQLGALRYAFAALPMVLLVRPPALRWTWVAAAGLTQLAQFGLLFLALRMGMTAALASVLMQTQVFFTALLGVLLLGERPGTPLRIALVLTAVGLGFFGMHFVGSVAAGGITLASLLLSLAAASMWAASNVVARRAQAAQPGFDALQFIVWMATVPILPFLAMSWFFDPAASRANWFHASAGAWLGAAYLGWCATVVAYSLWTWLLTRHPANRVAPFSLGVPLIGLVAGMALLGESVSGWQWAGSACVFAALAVVMFGSRMARRRG
ncbi:EamA family transporter [Xylophilus sp. Kf1]|nr:EamA family transporter [Xylophilus sp. Kf1]